MVDKFLSLMHDVSIPVILFSRLLFATCFCFVLLCSVLIYRPRSSLSVAAAVDRYKFRKLESQK